eukprot:scaffold110160_cov30-Prasinocladus_malaysianus.AAC.2
MSASWPQLGRHAIKVFLDGIKVLSKNCRSAFIATFSLIPNTTGHMPAYTSGLLRLDFREMFAICGGSPLFCYDVLHSVHCKCLHSTLALAMPYPSQPLENLHAICFQDSNFCFIGDMNYNHAYEYYTKLIVCMLPKELQMDALKQDVFSEVFKIVGGRVGDIRDMVVHFGAVGVASLQTATQFPKLARCKTRLQQLLLMEFDDEDHEVDTAKPEWTQTQICKALLALCNAENSTGCVELQEIMQLIGDPKALRSMFEHEVLLYRPQFPLHEDFLDNRYSDMVAAYSPLDLYCLKNMLLQQVSEAVAQ